MPSERKNPGALAGATGADREKSYSSKYAKIGPHGQGRDPFAEARDMFIMRVIAEPRATEAAVKIAVAMAVGHANRIAFERNGTLTAWPSMRTIAAKLGMFRGRVARALALLEEIGLITVVRPDKRGATHHNQYVLHPVTTLSDQETGDGIGLTTVAKSGEKNGLIAEDNIEAETGIIGLTAEDAMASRVGPKSIEEPLDGAGAQTRPAPFSTVGSFQGDVVEGDPQQDLDAKCGLPALEAPAPASTDRADVDREDPNAWRSKPEFSSMTRLASTGCAQEVSFCGSVDATDDPFDEPNDLGIYADSDDDEAEAEFAKAIFEAVECLHEIYGDTDVDAKRHAEDVIEGLSGGEPAALARVVRQIAALQGEIPVPRRSALFKLHCDVLLDLIAKTCGGPRYAEKVLAKFIGNMQQSEGLCHG